MLIAVGGALATAFCEREVIAEPSGCQASLDEKRLLANLLIGYNKLSRPVQKPAEPVRLKLGVSLREAVDLNEDLGQVKVLIWLKMIWKDEYLNWNPDQFGGIERLHIAPDRIWTPDIILYNALHSEPDGEQNHLKLSVLHNGDVTWVRPVTYTVTCKHEFRGNAWLCPFTFGSWVYNVNQLDIGPEGKKTDLNDEHFLSSDHFILLGHEGRRQMLKDKCCGGPFTTMQYLIKLRNKIGPALLGRK